MDTNTRPFVDRRPARHGTYEGEAVAFVRLPNAHDVTVSRHNREGLLRLGYTPNLTLKSNGGDKVYVALKAPGALPHLPPGHRDLGRLIMAYQMVCEERQGGCRAPEKGWIARTLNGDPYDLRDSNIERVPAGRRRHSFHDVCDIRRRFASLDAGVDPRVAIAEERRKFRERRQRDV